MVFCKAIAYTKKFRCVFVNKNVATANYVGLQFAPKSKRIANIAIKSSNCSTPGSRCINCITQKCFRIRGKSPSLAKCSLT